MIHELKINQCYLIHILEGKKNFEVRLNDRDFQIGDTIRFLPLEDKQYNVYDIERPIPQYKITYVHTGLGMAGGYVVLGIVSQGKDK